MRHVACACGIHTVAACLALSFSFFNKTRPEEGAGLAGDGDVALLLRCIYNYENEKYSWYIFPIPSTMQRRSDATCSQSDTLPRHAPWSLFCLQLMRMCTLVPPPPFDGASFSPS
jgi:hypothetical protein